MNNQNKKSGSVYLPIILIVIILGAIGAGGYVYTKNQNQLVVTPTPITTPDNSFKTLPVTTTTDETANWKTYKSEKYGFEFKYPAEWRVFENDNRVDIHTGQTGTSDLGSITATNDLTISEAIDGHLFQYVPGTRVQLEDDITLSGEKGKLVYQNTGGRDLPNDSLNLSKWYFVVHANKVYKIGIYYRSENNDLLFSRLLSTFKFAK